MNSEKLKQIRDEIKRLETLSKLIFDTKALKAVENKIWELADGTSELKNERTN